MLNCPGKNLKFENCMIYNSTELRDSHARVRTGMRARALHRSNLTHVYTVFISPPEIVVRQFSRVTGL